MARTGQLPIARPSSIDRPGARIRCIGSDPKRAHGLRPALALLDEPAQWERAKADAMLAAIRTGLGKVPNSKLIALGTRPVGPDHWFARMLREADYRQVHAAADDAPPFQKRTIRRANPSYDHLPSLRGRLEKELRDAKRDSGLLASWRSLRLNQGTGDTVEAYLVDASTWREAEGDAPQGDWCVWGVDLGTGAAMSAVAAFWPGTGRLETFAAFPERPSLYQRGIDDGVADLYTKMAARGELILARRAGCSSARTAEGRARSVRYPDIRRRRPLARGRARSEFGSNRRAVRR